MFDAAPGGSSLWGDDPGDLYRLHVREVYRFLASKVGRDLGDDLTAQTFAEAWAQRSSFDPEKGTPRAWLVGIAGNVLRHHFRQEQRRASAQIALAGHQHPGGFAHGVEEEVCEALIAAEQVAALRRVLSGVEDVDRELLMLAAHPDASYQGLADQLGLPIGTVRSRLSRARQRLAAQIDAAPLP